MEVIYINDKISPVLTASGTDIGNFEGADRFPRKSYKFLAYCLSEKGYKVKQDLPGTDNEQLVLEVLARNSHWLNA